MFILWAYPTYFYPFVVLPSATLVSTQLVMPLAWMAESLIDIST